MTLSMRWVGSEDLDRVAHTRWLCYGKAGRDLARFNEWIRLDPRAVAGDFLLAEENGAAVGTSTSMQLVMYVRGAALRCQGVAYVGTIKTARRRGTAGEAGVASAVMHEMLRKARERGEVISALKPFRVSYYQHFGYGLVERQNVWTIPLSILPKINSVGWRIAEPADQAAIAQNWQRGVEAGQCDIHRSDARWTNRFLSDDESMRFVCVSSSGAITAMAQAMPDDSIKPGSEGRSSLRLVEWSADSFDAFVGMLGFFGSLRDQHSAIRLHAPSDWPLNRVLREQQLPHRPVEHDTAEMRPNSLLQIRILDHRKFLESLYLSQNSKGRATFAIKETEGHFSRFTVDVADGRANVAASSADADFECTDEVWASLATGELSARQALMLGQARCTSQGALDVLQALARGPAPFCREAF